ncbi:hypothetical protein [Raoultibacter phocaeensis]|uniref:hypothetical protein n=1 Tax=Raoultibacter phocaeensis TaxID=2479841 RepID=UPI001119BAFE|nr:hypothetical protein [Raoultibacter phocaeensis]
MKASGNTAEWTGALDALCEFVSSEAGIGVTRTSLAVPPDSRERFYGLVAEVQHRLTEEVLSERIDEARRISSLCSAQRERVLAMTGLRELKLPATLEAFLADPVSALEKPSFGLVLDVVQNVYGVEGLEKRAILELPAFCETLERCAYELWAYFGIVAALEPTRFYAVYSPDTVEVHAVDTDSVTIGSQTTSPERRMPEAAFETQDGRVFAMKTEAARELDYYGAKIQRRRDTSAGGNTEGLLGHRVLLLYELDSLDAIEVVADREKLKLVCPDLFCEVLQPADMAYPAFVSAFVERIGAVRSRRPVQVICKDASGSFPEGMLEDIRVPPIACTQVGYRESELTRIAGVLA